MTKTSMTLKNSFFFLYILCASTLYAQEGELPEEQIIIQKDKKIVLPEVSKPQEKVTLTLKPLPQVKQTYKYKDFNLALPLLDPKLNPPILRNEKELPVKEGFIRLGFGNYGSSLFDGYYNSGKQKDYAFGIFAKHLASANGPVSNSGFSNNEAGAYAKYFTPNFTLSGGLNYNRGRYNFYGYDREEFPNRKSDSTKQVIQSILFQMNLEKINKKSPLTYNLGLGIGNISDRFKASESEFSIDFNGKYKTKDSSAITLFSDLSLAKKTDSSSVNRSLWRFQPGYHFVYKNLQIDAAIQFSVANEPELKESLLQKNTSKFHIHPQIRIQHNIFQNKLIAFVGIGGGMNKRTLRTSLLESPFLGPNPYLRHENQLLNFYLGIKGQIQNQLTYSSQISIESLKNQAFFLNNFEEQEKLFLVYDSSKTSRFTWVTEVTYDLSKETKAGIRFSLLSYGVKSVKQPWHLPHSMVTLFGRQYLSENLMLSAEFYYMGGIKAMNMKTLETETIKPLADLNLKGEYFFKKTFSGFISVHNLLNNKNQRFNYYPTQGFRIMIGASAMF